MSKLDTQKMTALSLFMFMLQPVFAAEDTKNQEVMVSEGISAPILQQDLQSLRTKDLKKMIDSPENRMGYIRKLYANQNLEKHIVKKGLKQSQPLLASLKKERVRLLTKALVIEEFENIKLDMEALAKERYIAKPESYRVRKKVKIALIFIQKKEGEEEEQAKSKIMEIMAKLKKEPDNHELFHDLAKQHSEGGKAKQGGRNEKWLIAPVSLETSSPLIQATYALQNAGENSDIIETEQGFIIVKLMAVTPGAKLPFKNVKEDIIRDIQSELYAAKKAEVIGSLQARENLLINDELVKTMIVETYKSR